MTTINEIFRTFGPEYLERYAKTMPKTHLKAIDAIVAYRTEVCGVALYQCESCGVSHQLYRSCLPVRAARRQVAIAIARLANSIRLNSGFKNTSSANSPRTISFSPLRSQRTWVALSEKTSVPLTRPCLRPPLTPLKNLPPINITSVEICRASLACFTPFGYAQDRLWGRTLQYHPHIHYIVPGGALSSTDGRWHPSRTDFYLPVKALSKIFRAKFHDEMIKAGLFDQIPPEVWHIDWNVNSQAVPCSEACLKYLAPYVFKVAISNSRILKVEDRTVLIRFSRRLIRLRRNRKPHSSRLRTLPFEVMEFIRRFLQHVLPTGFMKVRYYGFMNPNCAISLDRVSTLIEMTYGFNVVLPKTDLEPRRPITCPSCGGPLKLRSLLLPSRVLAWSG